METKINALRAENWMVFALGVGLFLSKPIIYAATGVLTVYFLVRCIKDAAYRQTAFKEKRIVAALVIYIFGLIACLLMPTTIEDFGVLARKSLYLVIFAPLLLAFRQPSNKNFAIAGLLIGFWIAAVLTFLQIEQLQTGRLPGATWMVDVWGVLLALFFVFLTPRIFNLQESTPIRVIFALTALTAFILLMLSGARGPWLGACVAVGLYLLFYQRRALGVLLVLAIIAYLPIKHFAPAPVAQLEQRITSITDTKADMSNWIRLTLWKLSFAQSIEKLDTHPIALLLGTGGESHYAKTMDFFERTNALTFVEKERLSHPDVGYPTNDTHNMYLGAVAKHGLIWAAANVIFLLILAFGAMRKRLPSNQAILAVPALVVCFLVTGMFYELLAHFATTFLIFFVALADRSNAKQTLVNQYG